MLIAVAWAVGLRAAIRWHGRSAGSGATEEDDDGAKKGVELARLLPPVAPPSWTLTGADSVRLDPRWVIGLVRAKRTRELGETLEAAQGKFEQDPSKEPWMDALFEGLGFAGAAELPVLDAWVASSPGSFSGYAARAAARLTIARRAKPAACDPSGRRTPSPETKRTLSLAREDLESALARAPRLLAAHTLLLRSFVDEGSAVPRDLFQRAIAACAACSGPRVQFLLGLRPGWGGTYEAMHAFAQQSQAWGRDNPRLRALLGYVDWTDCSDLLQQKKYTLAREACDRALAAYPAADFLRQQALVSYWEGEYEKAVAAMSAILTQDPYDVDALVERARGYTKLEDWTKAAADLRQALELEPDHEGGLTLYGWLFERLDRDARFAARNGDLGDMLDAYDLAARAIPEHRGFREARDAIEKRAGGARAQRRPL